MYPKLAVLFLLLQLALLTTSDMLRKSIVFDEATPDVFYCPVEKTLTFEQLYVRARPLKALCEYKGGRLPSSYKSDCYNDVDESEFACSEKKRIMMRLKEEQIEELELHSNSVRDAIHPNDI